MMNERKDTEKEGRREKEEEIQFYPRGSCQVFLDN